MSTLFAFFHHVAAFTLVSALAVEFVLIRQDLTLAICAQATDRRRGAWGIGRTSSDYRFVAGVFL